MSDLDKLIEKMQKEKVPSKKPVEKPSEDEEKKKKTNERQEEEVDEKSEIEENEEMEDEEDNGEEDEEETASGNSKPISATSKNEEVIKEEVSLLQNAGIFRRELLMTLKELVDVHKINTQTLLDLKKAVVGDKNEKK